MIYRWLLRWPGEPAGETPAGGSPGSPDQFPAAQLGQVGGSRASKQPGTDVFFQVGNGTCYG